MTAEEDIVARNLQIIRLCLFKAIEEMYSNERRTRYILHPTLPVGDILLVTLEKLKGKAEIIDQNVLKNLPKSGFFLWKARNQAKLTA